MFKITDCKYLLIIIIIIISDSWVYNLRHCACNFSTRLTIFYTRHKTKRVHVEVVGEVVVCVIVSLNPLICSTNFLAQSTPGKRVKKIGTLCYFWTKREITRLKSRHPTIIRRKSMHVSYPSSPYVFTI